MLQVDIDKMLEKLSEFCGFNNDFSNDNSTAEILKKVRKEFQQFESLPNFLAYRYYDEKNKIFISDDSHKSALIELTPLVGVSETKSIMMESFFANELPEGSHLNFLLIASADIQDSINLWKRDKNMKDDLIKKIVSKREDFLKKKSMHFRGGEKIIPRNFKLYLSFTKHVKNQVEYLEFKTFLNRLERKLDNLDLNPRFLNSEDLIEIVCEILEVNQKKKTGYNPNLTLKEQILTPLNRHDILSDRIEHKESNLTSKCYFARNYPKYLNMQQMIKLLGDPSIYSNIIEGRFIISYSIAKNIGYAESRSLVQKGNRIIEAAEQWYSRNNRNIIREAAGWREVNDKAKNGDLFFTEFFQIMLTSETNHIEQAEQNLLSLYQSLGWELVLVKYFTLPTLLAILPLQAYLFWFDLRFYRLSRVALCSEVVAKLPIHAEWKGVPSSGMLLLGRRGQLFSWNPFYKLSSGNYNICIFGPSGSGKSVFLQELAVNLVAQNTKIFILDIGKSFQNICKLLGGEIIEFGQENSAPLNPFCKFTKDLKGDDRNIAILYAKTIICSMASATSDSLKESIIEKAIIEALNLYGSDLDITKFSEILVRDSNCPIRNNISLSLFSYTKDGIYGKFFANNSKNVQFDKDITIFEFEEIKNNNRFLSIVLQIIGMQIFMQFLTGGRERPFLLIVDEAWMILDRAAKFLAEFARTIRKYGGSLAVCVQNYSDLDGDSHRKAILENSSWTILLKQDEKGLGSFKNSEAFKEMVPLIKSLSIDKDNYAELLIFSTGMKIVGRLVLDDFSKILYSTDAAIFAEIKKLESDGLSLEESIDKISRRKNV